MTLLKNDDSIPVRTQKVEITAWPDERKAEGLGISFNDGWYFGIGFGLALSIAIPIILMVIAFVIAAVLAILGAI